MYVRTSYVLRHPVASFHTVFSWDNNSVFIALHSKHQQFYWWDVSNSVFRHPVAYIVSAYLVSYCLLVRTQQRFHHPTLRTSTVMLVGCIEQSTISGKHVRQCCILVHVSCFFWGLGCCPLLYVLTSCVLRHPVSYFVSAYLVSYCLLVLLVRQQQRFHHPTLRTTSVTLVGCIEKIKGCRV